MDAPPPPPPPPPRRVLPTAPPVPPLLASAAQTVHASPVVFPQRSASLALDAQARGRPASTASAASSASGSPAPSPLPPPEHAVPALAALGHQHPLHHHQHPLHHHSHHDQHQQLDQHQQQQQHHHHHHRHGALPPPAPGEARAVKALLVLVRSLRAQMAAAADSDAAAFAAARRRAAAADPDADAAAPAGVAASAMAAPVRSSALLAPADAAAAAAADAALVPAATAAAAAALASLSARTSARPPSAASADAALADAYAARGARAESSADLVDVIAAYAGAPRPARAARTAAAGGVAYTASLIAAYAADGPGADSVAAASDSDADSDADSDGPDIGIDMTGLDDAAFAAGLDAMRARLAAAAAARMSAMPAAAGPAGPLPPPPPAGPLPPSEAGTDAASAEQLQAWNDEIDAFVAWCDRLAATANDPHAAAALVRIGAARPHNPPAASAASARPGPVRDIPDPAAIDGPYVMPPPRMSSASSSVAPSSTAASPVLSPTAWPSLSRSSSDSSRIYSDSIRSSADTLRSAGLLSPAASAASPRSAHSPAGQMPAWASATLTRPSSGGSSSGPASPYAPMPVQPLGFGGVRRPANLVPPPIPSSASSNPMRQSVMMRVTDGLPNGVRNTWPSSSKRPKKMHVKALRKLLVPRPNDNPIDPEQALIAAHMLPPGMTFSGFQQQQQPAPPQSPTIPAAFALPSSSVAAAAGFVPPRPKTPVSTPSAPPPALFDDEPMPSQVVTLSRGYGQSGGGTPRRNPGGGTLSRPNGLTAMPPVAGSAPTGTLYLSQPSSLSSSGYPLSSLDSMLPYEPVSQSVSYYSSLSQQPMAQYASMSQPSDQSGRSATFTKQPIQSQPTQKQGLLSFSKQKYQITEADIEATRQKLDRILGL